MCTLKHRAISLVPYLCLRQALTLLSRVASHLCPCFCFTLLRAGTTGMSCHARLHFWNRVLLVVKLSVKNKTWLVSQHAERIHTTVKNILWFWLVPSLPKPFMPLCKGFQLLLRCCLTFGSAPGTQQSFAISGTSEAWPWDETLVLTFAGSTPRFMDDHHQRQATWKQRKYIIVKFFKSTLTKWLVMQKCGFCMVSKETVKQSNYLSHRLLSEKLV